MYERASATLELAHSLPVLYGVVSYVSLTHGYICLTAR